MAECDKASTTISAYCTSTHKHWHKCQLGRGHEGWHECYCGKKYKDSKKR